MELEEGALATSRFRALERALSPVTLPDNSLNVRRDIP